MVFRSRVSEFEGRENADGAEKSYTEGMRNPVPTACLLGTLLLVGAGCAPPPPAAVAPSEPVLRAAVSPTSPPPSVAPELTPQAAPSAPPPHVPALSFPIDHAFDRAAKKGFGLKVSPKHSPISPERFSGYHTGVDFETTPDEQESDVLVSTACDGTLALKKYASGYGGVAVERCKLDGADITVIYGHLRLSSVLAKVGQAFKAGDPLGVLGTGYSKETDGERKHLHFGVHKGAVVDIKGYVQRSSELGAWIDPLTLLK